ncbi:hypothetical protein C8K30_10277 [Promicromonospora sp. AC04]|uniref:DUF6912 family protein n=1 Tax=Promicromonospora sp. AC04 TaxID=2135723 RepID=UPI000D3AAF16|nr:hypothetical protein [Promicromonospora sp. AC04]PUB29702.1 hypothetical protein C8K30_10277 [Promicromonospora sp. AC04]
MRIYVPATLDELDAVTHATDATRWTVAPRRAHAVTKDLEAALPDEDAEGLEYIAALNAADDSLALIAGRPDAPHQRVIITVEVPDAAIGLVSEASDDDEPVASEIQVTSTVEHVAIICVHVDEVEAAADIADVLAAADEESDAEATAEVGEESETALDEALQRVTDRDLLWYDWSELKDVPRA